MPAEWQPQLVGQVAPGALIEAEERPGAAPVQPEGEVPGHAVELHRRIEGGPKGPLGLLVFRVRQLQAEGEHLPELVDVIKLAVFGVGEEPRLLVVEHRDALKALGHRLAHPQEPGQLGGDGLAPAIADAAVEQAKQGEGVDVLDEALAAIGELVAAEQVQGLVAGLRLLEELDQGLAVVLVLQQAIGERRVEAGPLEAGMVFHTTAEALAPEGIVAEAIEILGLLGKGEGDQGIGFPVAGRHLPDGGLIGVEIPLAGRTDPLPVHAHLAAIAIVFGNHAGGLDRHHRHGVAGVVEGKVVLADVGGLDGDALTHAHAAHLGGDAFVVEAVLPDPFIDEAIGLVAAIHHGAHEPTGGGALGAAESGRGGIHAVVTLRHQSSVSILVKLMKVSTTSTRALRSDHH
jgi:hypothetical protein